MLLFNFLWSTQILTRLRPGRTTGTMGAHHAPFTHRSNNNKGNKGMPTRRGNLTLYGSMLESVIMLILDMNSSFLAADLLSKFSVAPLTTYMRMRIFRSSAISLLTLAINSPYTVSREFIPSNFAFVGSSLAPVARNILYVTTQTSAPLSTLNSADLSPRTMVVHIQHHQYPVLDCWYSVCQIQRHWERIKGLYPLHQHVVPTWLLYGKPSENAQLGDTYDTQHFQWTFITRVPVIRTKFTLSISLFITGLRYFWLRKVHISLVTLRLTGSSTYSINSTGGAIWHRWRHNILTFD